MRPIRIALALLPGIVGGAACARAQSPAPAAAPAAGDSALPQDRYGTLSQNDIAIRLRTDELEVRFVPLDARVTSLLARDAAQSLQRTVARNRAAIDSAGRAAGISEPGLALVTFFGLKPGVRFSPELLTVTARNQFLRPLAMVPLGSRFGAGQLNAQESAMAVYLFEDLLPVWDPFSVNYENLVSNEWERRLPTLYRERDRLSAAPR
ncbi:MAG TPA: hypothetical protein VFU00_12005 [Gemmatimonadales bacterium]|nr:hypothetical protein [Gemmatimonadales bacterium]